MVMHRLESPVCHAKKIGPATVDAGNGVNVASLIEDRGVEGGFEGRGELSLDNFPFKIKY